MVDLEIWPHPFSAHTLVYFAFDEARNVRLRREKRDRPRAAKIPSVREVKVTA